MTPAPAAELPAHLAELLHRATAAEQPLCRIDEAQLLAVGWALPGRPPGQQFAGAASPHDFPGLDVAQDALVAAGLGERGGRSLPVGIEPAGPLRDYLTLVVRHRLQSGIWFQRPAGDVPGIWSLRRLTAVRELPVVVIERVGGDGRPAGPLEIEIAVVSRDAAATELAALAYRPPVSAAERASTTGTESVLMGPFRKLGNVPSGLEHGWDEPAGVLHWRSVSRWRRVSAQTWPRETPEAYRDHLVERLQVPEPPLPGR